MKNKITTSSQKTPGAHQAPARSVPPTPELVLPKPTEPDSQTNYFTGQVQQIYYISNCTMQYTTCTITINNDPGDIQVPEANDTASEPVQVEASPNKISPGIKSLPAIQSQKPVVVIYLSSLILPACRAISTITIHASPQATTTNIWSGQFAPR